MSGLMENLISYRSPLLFQVSDRQKLTEQMEERERERERERVQIVDVSNHCPFISSFVFALPFAIPPYRAACG